MNLSLPAFAPTLHENTEAILAIAKSSPQEIAAYINGCDLPLRPSPKTGPAIPSAATDAAAVSLERIKQVLISPVPLSLDILRALVFNLQLSDIAPYAHRFTSDAWDYWLDFAFQAVQDNSMPQVPNENPFYIAFIHGQIKPSDPRLRAAIKEVLRQGDRLLSKAMEEEVPRSGGSLTNYFNILKFANMPPLPEDLALRSFAQLDQAMSSYPVATSLDLHMVWATFQVLQKNPAFDPSHFPFLLSGQLYPPPIHPSKNYFYLRLAVIYQVLLRPEFSNHTSLQDIFLEILTSKNTPSSPSGWYPEEFPSNYWYPSVLRPDQMPKYLNSMQLESDPNIHPILQALPDSHFQAIPSFQISSLLRHRDKDTRLLVVARLSALKKPSSPTL